MDFSKIEVDGELLGVLNFNLMIPVDESLLQEIDVVIRKKDRKPITIYKSLCQKELLWCQEHSEVICNKANVLYKKYISGEPFAGKAIVTFPAENIILNEGDLCPDMFKIIHGRAEMYIGYGTDKEVLLGIIGPGTCFGEFGLLMKAPAIYTVIAYSDVYAIRVTEEKIGSFIKENHTSVFQIMKNMAQTMAIMQHQVMSLSEELSTFNQNLEDDFSIVQKELLRGYYVNNTRIPFKLKGKMYFLGNNGTEKS